MADLLTQAMDLADSYAKRRAFFAAHPFTREKDESAAEKARDDARAALASFLAQHLAHGVLASHGKPEVAQDADGAADTLSQPL